MSYFEIDVDLQRLVDPHPLIFRGKPPTVFSYVSVGWYALIDKLCIEVLAKRSEKDA